MKTARQREYREWLQSDNWKSIRGAAILANKAKCCICGHVSNRNDVHHVIYRDNWDDTQPSDLRVLCRRCHDAAHTAIDQIGDSYYSLPYKDKWNATLEMISSQELIPEHFLKKIVTPKVNIKVNKRKLGRNDREAEKTRADIRFNLRGVDVQMNPNLFKRISHCMTKEGAKLLGMSFPLDKGWKSAWDYEILSLDVVEQLFHMRYKQRLSVKSKRIKKKKAFKPNHPKSKKKKRGNPTPPLSTEEKALKKAKREVKRLERKHERMREHEKIVEAWGGGRQQYSPRINMY